MDEVDEHHNILSSIHKTPCIMFEGEKNREAP